MRNFMNTSLLLFLVMITSLLSCKKDSNVAAKTEASTSERAADPNGPVLIVVKPENTETQFIYALKGSTITFSVSGKDSEGNMAGVEWYNNVFIGSESFSPTGDKTISRSIKFDAVGDYAVSCVAYDSNSKYGNGIKWVVKIIDQERTAYVDWSDEIIGSANAENSLLEWAKFNKINGLSLYIPVVTLTNNHNEINAFIAKAKTFGVTRFSAVIGNGDADLTAVLSYIDDPKAPNKFTGVLTEIEYWDPATYDKGLADYLAVLAKMRAASDSRNGAFKVESYNGGGISVDETNKLCKYLDRVLMVCYTSSTDIQSVYYTYRRDRLQYFLTGAANNNRMIDIAPLFSFEPDFSGGKPYENVDNSFIGGFINDQGLTNKYKSAVLKGAHYFTYYYMNPNKIYVPRPYFHIVANMQGTDITITKGTTLTFKTQGNDQDGDFNGADWYVNGAMQGSEHITPTVQADVSHNITFNTAGTYSVQARLRDAKGNYTPLAYLTTITIRVN